MNWNLNDLTLDDLYDLQDLVIDELNHRADGRSPYDYDGVSSVPEWVKEKSKAEGNILLPPGGDINNILLVNPVSPQTTEADLYQLFSDYAPLIGVTIATRQLPSGGSYSYAYVLPENSEDIEVLTRNLNGKRVNGVPIRVGRLVR